MFVAAFMLGVATATLLLAKRDLARSCAFAAAGGLSLLISLPVAAPFDMHPFAASLAAAQEDVPERTPPAAETAKESDRSGERADGAASDGAASDGAANDGAANDGAANDRAANDRAANDRAAKDGGSDPVEGTTSQLSADTQAQPLSVEPLAAEIEAIFPDRDGSQPDWLELAGAWDGRIYRVAVHSGPEANRIKSEQALEEKIRAAFLDYLGELLDSPQASGLLRYRLDRQKLDDLVRERFEETVEVSVGTMVQSHALLVFDEGIADQILAQWKEVKATNRLLQTGLGSLVVMLLLGALFGYFRMDTATRGYYTGRLQFATAGAILTIIAVSIMVAQWIPRL